MPTYWKFEGGCVFRMEETSVLESNGKFLRPGPVTLPKPVWRINWGFFKYPFAIAIN